MIVALLNGGATPQTGAENLRTLESAFAAYASAQEGKLVKVEGAPLYSIQENVLAAPEALRRLAGGETTGV